MSNIGIMKKQDYINLAKKKWVYELNRQFEVLTNKGFIAHDNTNWLLPQTGEKVNPYELAKEEYIKRLTFEEKIGEYFLNYPTKKEIDIMSIMNLFDCTPNEYIELHNRIKVLAKND